MASSPSDPIIVAGAGPAGLTAAHRLTEAGLPVVVLEAGDQVGGLARSIELWGRRVDLGPHRFFSGDRRVNEFWQEIVGPDHAWVDRLTRIRYRDRFFHYPLRAMDALIKLGPFEAARCVFSYLRQRLQSGGAPDHGSFEDWVVGRFGRRLFEIFFRTYSEKLWGLPCTELDADFAAQRIKGFSLMEALRSALPFGRARRHATLVDRFAYPFGGTGSVYEKMAEIVQRRGGRLRFQSPVGSVVLEEGRVARVVLASGEELPCRHLVSTMPLTLLVEGLRPAAPAPVLEASRRLRFRGTILVYLHLEGAGHFPDQWVYVHSPELKAGRVTNFNNWLPQVRSTATTTILAMEYWCNASDPGWKEEDSGWAATAEREIRGMGLVDGAKVLDRHVIRIPRCYPIYERGYKEHLKPIIAELKRIPNLHAIGRYGAFKYNNQDHSILMGLLAADRILGNRDHDLWGVNTDYATYQEAAEAGGPDA